MPGNGLLHKLAVYSYLRILSLWFTTQFTRHIGTEYTAAAAHVRHYVSNVRTAVAAAVAGELPRTILGRSGPVCAMANRWPALNGAELRCMSLDHSDLPISAELFAVFGRMGGSSVSL